MVLLTLRQVATASSSRGGDVTESVRHHAEGGEKERKSQHRMPQVAACDYALIFPHPVWYRPLSFVTITYSLTH